MILRRTLFGTALGTAATALANRGDPPRTSGMRPVADPVIDPATSPAWRDVNLLTVYGQSLAVDTGGGHPTTGPDIQSLIDRSAVTMPDTGPQTFVGGAGTNPTSYITYDQQDRQRIATAIVYWLQQHNVVPATAELGIDLPGRSGASIQSLSTGTEPLAQLERDAALLESIAAGAGRSMRQLAVFLKCGETNLRTATTPSSFRALFTSFCDAIRGATVDDGIAFPIFLGQLACHPRYTPTDPSVIPVEMGRMQGIVPGLIVTHPQYIHTGYDQVHHDRYGYTHSGLHFGKALERYLSGRSVEPCRLVDAALIDSHTIAVRLHVPYPPLQVSTTLVSEPDDGHHGLEVWTATGTRCTIATSTIADPTTGSIVIEVTDEVQAGDLVKIGCTADPADRGTIDSAKNIYPDYRSGPTTGVRSTLCDSDPATTSLTDEAGNQLDLRNYVLIGAIPIR